MEKHVVVLKYAEDKKHSVIFKPLDPDAAVTSIYVMRRCLGSSIPKQIKMTLEEV